MSFAVFKDFDKAPAGTASCYCSVYLYLQSYIVLIRSRYLYLTYRSIYLDLIADDFDSKYTLKIKSAGPSNSVRVDLFFSSGYDFYTLI